ncbi:MAG: hypothetical protein JWM28_3053 [Chitinophagaceae bacterium]|nr:hypothetical protein [Chitinophagaceae bacterium]
MIRNFLKITIRSLLKNKTNSFLNIFGLAIGMACAALIFLWVEHEVNYDNFNTKKDRLYFAMVNQLYDAGIFTHGSTPGVMAPVMQKEIPGIANTCRVSEDQTSLLFSIGGKSMYASGKYAEPSLFNMFTLPFVQGHAANAFNELHSIVITEKTARKFFGDVKNSIGKTVRVDNKQDYVVSGVLKDIPENSSLQFEWIAPFEIWYQQSTPWAQQWGNNCIGTYVELQPNTNIADVNKKLYDFVQQKEPKSIGHVFLFGMNDWRLHDQFENGKQTGSGRIVFVRLFSMIAWIILFIACINFMNLATARSEKRAREVGVRKVLGAGKKGLIFQFIGEALLMAMIAAVSAVLIVSIVLPLFNTLVQKQLSLNLENPLHVLSLLAIALVCGLVAGSYPSLYLSSFNPVFVLKGIKIKNGGASFIRKGLVVFQFSISIVLIIGTMIIYQQIQHVKTRNLGFNKDNLVELNMQGDMAEHFAAIKNDLLNTGVVENVALSDHGTIYGGNNGDGFTWEGKPPGTKVLISNRYVTPEFMSTSGISVLSGRNFEITDTAYNNGLHVMITASLERLMGKGSAIGKILRYEGDDHIATVIGVVNDYVYGNMYGKPDPVVFICAPPQNTTVMYIRTKAQSHAEEALAKIEAVIKKNNPAYPFEYRFVDDQFNGMFQSETLISKLSRVFASLAIIISCLGLFGLAAYTAERRTKEIGIRKVLGASMAGITGLLSKDFLKLVVLSAIIAFPIAWWAMHNWLQGYAYRITINGWVFVIAGALSVFIALFTISFQAVKAAMMNPVKSLRSE